MKARRVFAETAPQSVEYIKRGPCPESGAEIIQVTSSIKMHVNIYPETPVFASDSTRFVFSAYMSSYGKKEYWMCDLATLRMSLLADQDDLGGSVVSGDNFFYHTSARENAIFLKRISLDTLESETIGQASGFCRPHRLGSVSCDCRFYVTGASSAETDDFALLCFDLLKGNSWSIFNDPYLSNPHMEFEPGEGKDILAQWNRMETAGDQVASEERKASLFLMNKDERKMRLLNIGPPFSPNIQGHKCWLGNTRKVIATYSGDKADTLVTIAEGDKKPTPIARGAMFHHVASTPCGRWFVCDETDHANILVGSVRTGKYKVLCNSGASFGFPQYTHPHPFFSPDRKFVIFNSDKYGFPQIFVAAVPDGFLEELDNG